MANRILTANTETRGYMFAMNRIAKDSLPKAAAGTLNRIANGVTVGQERNAKQDFTIRTPFTLKSMESPRAKPYRALNKATGRDLSRMFSRAGTFSSYLWLQENDQTVRGIGNGPVPIALDAARTGKNPKKSVRRAYRISRNANLRGELGNNTFAGVPRGGNRKRGIYVRTNRNKRLTMIRNLEKNSIRIRGTHFHSRAVERYGNNRVIAAAFRHEAQKYIRGAH